MSKPRLLMPLKAGLAPLALAYDPNEPRDEKGQWTEGGGSKAGASIRDTYGTRTPAVKSKIRDIEDGPLSYVASMNHEDAMKELNKAKSVHEKHLEELRKIAAAKKEPEGRDYEDWQHSFARAGKMYPSNVWAEQLAVPQKESYLRGIVATEKALKFFHSRHLKKQSQVQAED